MTPFEGDVFDHGNGVQGESNNTHPSKGSWSNDTPNRVDIVSIYTIIYRLRKGIVIFYFRYCRSMSNFAIFDNEYFDIFGNGIDKKYHSS